MDGSDFIMSANMWSEHAKNKKQKFLNGGKKRKKKCTSMFLTKADDL